VSGTTAVAMRHHLAGRVAAPHSDPLGQNLLQLGRRAACDERSDQRQRVVVEVRLRTTSGPLSAQPTTYLLTYVSSHGFDSEAS